MKMRQSRPGRRSGTGNVLGINQHTVEAIEALQGIMQQLATDESVTIFDVALVQHIAEDIAGRLLNSLEKAGIVRSEWEKFTRISHGQPLTHVRKRYRLTPAYHRGLAVFEPTRLVGLGRAKA